MSLPTTFAALTAATGSELDDNFNALGVLTVLPYTVSGTNALSFAPFINTPTISVYRNYLVFSGVAAATNAGAVTVSVGGLPVLQVFRDSLAGPTALIGGEIVIGNSIIIVYDSTLASGAGGFHLVNPASFGYTKTAEVTVTSIPGTTLTAAQLTGSGVGSTILNRDGVAVGAFNDTTDTATAIIAALPGAAVGTTFRVRMSNTTTQTQTLLAGSGCTVTGLATTATGATHEFQAVVTATGTPAVVFYG